MIEGDSPATWRALQDQTARLLRESGFDVEIESSVRTVRGTVEVDVVATETVHGRVYTLFCECKHWKRRVPQTVTHAFRTVVAEAGAHVGYLISSAGFQSGAMDAARSTNLKLVTWEQFQDELEPQWIQSYLLPTVTTELDPLFSYIEPINSALYRGFETLTEERKALFRALRGRYNKFGWTAMMFTTHFQQLGKGLPHLPLNRPADAEDEEFPPGYFEIAKWREFLEVTLQFGHDAIVELRAALDQ